jgi:hypothetical protein
LFDFNSRFASQNSLCWLITSLKGELLDRPPSQKYRTCSNFLSLLMLTTCLSAPTIPAITKHFPLIFYIYKFISISEMTL